MSFMDYCYINPPGFMPQVLLRYYIFLVITNLPWSSICKAVNVCVCVSVCVLILCYIAFWKYTWLKALDLSPTNINKWNTALVRQIKLDTLQKQTQIWPEVTGIGKWPQYRPSWHTQSSLVSFQHLSASVNQYFVTQNFQPLKSMSSRWMLSAGWAVLYSP